MKTVQIEGTPLGLLEGFVEPVVFMNRDGTPVGTYQPVRTEQTKEIYDRMRRKLEEGRKSTNGKIPPGAQTTREVFEHLKSVTTDAKLIEELDRLIQKMAQQDA